MIDWFSGFARLDDNDFVAERSGELVGFGELARLGDFVLNHNPFAQKPCQSELVFAPQSPVPNSIGAHESP